MAPRPSAGQIRKQPMHLNGAFVRSRVRWEKYGWSNLSSNCLTTHPIQKFHSVSTLPTECFQTTTYYDSYFYYLSLSLPLLAEILVCSLPILGLGSKKLEKLWGLSSALRKLPATVFFPAPFRRITLMVVVPGSMPVWSPSWSRPEPHS